MDEALNEVSALDSCLLVGGVLLVHLIPTIDRALVLSFSDCFLQRHPTACGISDPISGLGVPIFWASFARFAHESCLAPKALDIAAHCKIRQEFRAIVDEPSNAFARDRMLRNSLEASRSILLGATYILSKRNREAYEHQVLHTSRVDLRWLRS